MPSMNSAFRSYMKNHLPLYVFVAVLFVTGVVFGAVMVTALSLEQQRELGRHLANFIHTLDMDADYDAGQSFWSMFSLLVKWELLIWILGLSMIGLPLIFVLDFLKGVLVGFTVGCLVAQYAWKGVLFSLVSVAPQNLIMVPVLVICSVTAIAFSLYLIRNRFLQRRGSVYRPLMNYCTLTLSMIALTVGVSLYEAYVSPQVMKWVTPMLAALS